MRPLVRATKTRMSEPATVCLPIVNSTTCIPSQHACQRSSDPMRRVAESDWAQDMRALTFDLVKDFTGAIVQARKPARPHAVYWTFGCAESRCLTPVLVHAAAHLLSPIVRLGRRQETRNEENRRRRRGPRRNLDVCAWAVWTHASQERATLCSTSAVGIHHAVRHAARVCASRCASSTTGLWDPKACVSEQINLIAQKSLFSARS